MRGSRKLCRRWSKFANLITLFIIFLKLMGDRGSKYRFNWAIIGPTAKHHGILLVGRWWPKIECWLGSFVIFQGIRTSIAKKPYVFVIFFSGGGGGGPDPPVPPLNPPVHNMWKEHNSSRLLDNLGLHVDQPIQLHRDVSTFTARP